MDKTAGQGGGTSIVNARSVARDCLSKRHFSGLGMS